MISGGSFTVPCFALLLSSGFDVPNALFDFELQQRMLVC
jgi:hypothetical protein